jgi:hypothetical protein
LGGGSPPQSPTIFPTALLLKSINHVWFAGNNMMIGAQIDRTLTDQMVEQAIQECAELHFAGNARRLRQAILSGQCEYCRCVSDHLARQISEYLGRVDNTVKAIYQYEPLDDLPATEEEARSPKRGSGIGLIAWVDRKSAAFSALVSMLETVLSESYRNLGCVDASPRCFALEVAMVDDRDVQDGRGFGQLVKNPYLHSTSVWKRGTESKPVRSEEEPQSVRVRFSLPDSFDPELIPESRLIEHALAIQNVPPDERAELEHHLMELKVTLIRRMISDQLAYIEIAKRWFSVQDLAEIYRRRIGFGKIGGKSAGMMLAARILQELAEEEIQDSLRLPESYFLGSELIYIFMAMNGLMHWNDQKYKPEEQIRSQYSQIREEFQAGEFPPEVIIELKDLLDKVGKKPLIVRSSSQLEDNFGTAFAGKYDSFFCPNQATPEENLHALTNAIARTYASTLNPDALLYRRRKGLQDYDERMAILIQVVQGEQFNHYFFPFAAGVAFSRNIYRWSPQIQREAGFARLVWGLGTRAVQRVGNDYPRMVALSHPLLQPDDSVEAIRYYSQQYVDLIDLEHNDFTTMSVHEVLSPRYPALRFLAQLEQDGFFATPRARVASSDVSKLAITFSELLRRTPFASLMTRILRILEQNYHATVDVEFTVHIPDPSTLQPNVQIALLQCRPQSHLGAAKSVRLPEDLTPEEVIFSTRFIVPQGYLHNIRYVIFVSPEGYYALPTQAARSELGHLISRVNTSLPPKSFICVGPGRWGTTNLDLGVYVSYADICNAGALVELAGEGIGPTPEPSLGTHFFQDLMEAEIYPLAICFGRPDVVFNKDFFYNTPNRLAKLIPEEGLPTDCLRVIEVASYKPGHHLELAMDDEKGKAVAFLSPDE